MTEVVFPSLSVIGFSSKSSATRNPWKRSRRSGNEAVTPGGVVNVHIAQVEDTIEIVIADNGCGIPAEHLPKVMQKFYKANQTVRGSGIGLAVADEIIRLHKGTLNIDSVENVGTTVTITLPIVRPPLPEETEQEP